ncbi:MAG: hypothetical protein MPN21_04250 [Thermoanaerobaculia bacterium]|nr:hypothetical protein [Thermoanaerobaculia bacterium]
MQRMFALIAVLSLVAVPADAELSKPDRKAVKKMLDGTLYMRIDAPYASGRHAWGTYKRPLVEVSPEGSETNADYEVNASWWHADSTYWGIRVNDSVELDEVDFDDGEVEIELEGVGTAEDEATVVKFVEIHSLDDFQAAFDQTFATVPLQDLHDDWPADIKQAIADRTLVDGMTKRQAYYVVGTPQQFQKSEENGVEIETWTVRTFRGTKMGFWRIKSDAPAGDSQVIRFEDGVLINASQAGSSSDFSLDD